MAQNYGKKINFILKLLTILIYYLPGTSIRNHLELPMDPIHIASFELQYRANNRNIPSYKNKQEILRRSSLNKFHCDSEVAYIVFVCCQVSPHT